MIRETELPPERVSVGESRGEHMAGQLPARNSERIHEGDKHDSLLICAHDPGHFYSRYVG